MESSANERLTSLVAELVREALARGETVRVPGLGTFGVSHHSSQVEQAPDGQLVMLPPRDEVSFTPET